MITAYLKTAEEITGVKGCEYFGTVNNTIIYTFSMNRIAKEKLKLELSISQNKMYDYSHNDFYVKKEWLRDIQEEVELEIGKEYKVCDYIHLHHDDYNIWKLKQCLIKINKRYFFTCRSNCLFAHNFIQLPDGRIYNNLKQQIFSIMDNKEENLE